MNSTLPYLPYLPTFPPSPISAEDQAGVDDYFDPGMWVTDDGKDENTSDFIGGGSSVLLYTPDEYINTSPVRDTTSQYLSLDLSQPGPSTYHTQLYGAGSPVSPAESLHHTPASTGYISREGVVCAVARSNSHTPQSIGSIPSLLMEGALTGPSTAASTVPDLDDLLDINQLDRDVKVRVPSGIDLMAGSHITPPEDRMPSEEASLPEGEGEGEEEVEMDNEEPLYVNAKQYHRILKRRLARARLEELNRLSRSRKPYLHESRHRHACNRPRGKGGRFLTADEIEALKRQQQQEAIQA